MKNKAKIRLSTLEMDLVKNSDWILTKNGILQKAMNLLGELQSGQQHTLSAYAHVLPTEVTAIAPKISKGENYKGLPWLVLDYPRCFKKGNHFAVRTMFWWGHFFSITLHLSGIYKQKYLGSIERSFGWLQDEQYFICTGAEEWEHHFEAGNYDPLPGMLPETFTGHLHNKAFLKLAKNYPLEIWDDAGEILLDSYSGLIALLADQLPSR